MTLQEEIWGIVAQINTNGKLQATSGKLEATGGKLKTVYARLGLNWEYRYPSIGLYNRALWGIVRIRISTTSVRLSFDRIPVPVRAIYLESSTLYQSLYLNRNAYYLKSLYNPNRLWQKIKILFLYLSLCLKKIILYLRKFKVVETFGDSFMGSHSNFTISSVDRMNELIINTWIQC